MFLKSIFSSQESFKDNYFNNNQNFIPNIEQKIKLYFKKCNKYQKILLPQDLESDEIEQIKDEDILQTNNNSFLDNIIRPSTSSFNDDIINDSNSNIIELDESKVNNPKELDDSLNKRIPEKIIHIESSFSRFKPKNGKNKIFSTVYPKKVTLNLNLLK